MGLIDQIISVESGGKSDATNPRSTAVGPGQFTEGTWLDTITKNRPDLVQGKSRDEILAMRTDPDLSREMTGALANQNAGILSNAGVAVTPGSTYLAHFAGPKGAIGILNADPSTPAGAVLGDRAVKANPFLAKMTAGDLAAWADRKMGGAPMSMAGPTSPAGPALPTTQAAAPPAQPQKQPAFQITGSGDAAAPNLAALTATPQLQNLLPARPNVYGLKIAPFSLARTS